MVLKCKIDTWKSIEQSLEIDPHKYGRLIFVNVQWQFNEEKTVFSTHGARKPIALCKKMNSDLCLTPIQKLTQNGS